MSLLGMRRFVLGMRRFVLEQGKVNQLLRSAVIAHGAKTVRKSRYANVSLSSESVHMHMHTPT